jgi:hypothetical protein
MDDGVWITRNSIRGSQYAHDPIRGERVGGLQDVEKWIRIKVLFVFLEVLLHGRKREGERKGDEMLDPILCLFVVIHFLNVRYWMLAHFFGLDFQPTPCPPTNSLSSNKAPIKPKVRWV